MQLNLRRPLSRLRAFATNLAARATPIALGLLTLFVATVSWAQEAIPPTPVDFSSEEAVAKLVLDAVLNRQWGLLVALILTATVAMLRKYVPAHTKLGSWFKSKVGGVVSTLLLALGGGFVTQLLAHVPFSPEMVVKAISLALSANGLWSVWKNIREAVDESKSSDAGKATETTPPPGTLNQ